jgi:DNA-binding NtrC family response regulator
MPRILMIEDEDMLRLTTGDYLRDQGHEVVEAADGTAGLAALGEASPDVVLLDLNLPGLSGHEVLAALRERSPDLPVIIVSGATGIQDAVRALKNGACDFITKPVQDYGVLEHAVDQALEISRLRRQNAAFAQRFLGEELTRPEVFAAMTTSHPRMLQIFRYCEAVACGPEPILITGETGVGKEELAKAVHELSGRAGQFVAVNVAGLDDQTFSDTLFGHIRGAYTGADGTRPGLVERAAGGTLFLDEIGELDPRAQVKLLRVLQEKEYFPLGSDLPRRMTARILAATNRRLDSPDLEAAGINFRQDLFFRLRTHLVVIPPLRERLEDLEPLTRRFIAQASAAFDRQPPLCPPEVLDVLARLAFPGNVRELRGMVFDAVARCPGDTLGLADFGAKVADLADQAPTPPADVSELFSGLSSLPTPRQAGDALVAEALRRAGGRQSEAARLLGLTPQALSNRLRRGA